MGLAKVRFGLRSKIIFLIVTGVVLIEAAGNILDYYSNKQLLLHQIEHQHNALTGELNQALVDLSANGASSSRDALSRPSVQQLAQTLVQSDKILLAVVSYNKDSATLGQGTLLAGESPYSSPEVDIVPLQNALNKGSTTYVLDHVGSSTLLKTFVPTRLPTGEQYVDEFITNYGQAVQNVIQKQLRMSILISILVLFLVIVFSYMLARYITNPLFRLKQHIGSVRSLETTETLRLHRNDEIGDLANGVNEMSTRLAVHFNRAIHDERTSAMKYLGMITHSLIHELRSPSLSIRNLLSLLPTTQQTFTPQAEETLRHLATSSDHLNSVIEHFGRIVREGSPLPMNNHDVADIVQQAVGVCSPLAERNGISVTTERSPGRYIARVDDTSLRRVVVNLLQNGIDAMAAASRKGEVTVCMTVHLHRLHIDVTDHGPGIPRERWTEIFMPFKSTKENGFGLGLALSAMLITGMGGNIFVKQSSPSGTTMRITLPTVEICGTRNRFFVDTDQANAR